MDWKKGTKTDKKIIGDDGDVEILCEHGIGHGYNVHTCDPDQHGGRCPITGYRFKPLNKKTIYKKLVEESLKENEHILEAIKESGD